MELGNLNSIPLEGVVNVAQELMELQRQTDTQSQEREDKIGQLLVSLENELQGIDN